MPQYIGGDYTSQIGGTNTVEISYTKEAITLNGNLVSGEPSTLRIYFVQDEQMNPLLDNSSSEDPKPYLSVQELNQGSAQSAIAGNALSISANFSVNNDEPVLYHYVVVVD